MEIQTAAYRHAPRCYINLFGEKKGICRDVIKALERENQEIKITGYEKGIKYKDALTHLQNGSIDFILGFNRKTAEKYQFKIVSPSIYSTGFAIASRRDDPGIDVNLIELRRLSGDSTLLVRSKSIEEKVLKNYEIFNLDNGGSSFSLMFKKILAKRGRFVFGYEMDLVQVIRKENLTNHIKILPNRLWETQVYFIFSPKVPKENVILFENALLNLERKKILQNINKKYFSF